MYSLGALFQKQPAVIAGTVRSVVWILVLLGIIALEEAALAAIALGLEAILTLFVVQTSTPTANAQLRSGTEVRVAGTNDTVVIQPSPPGPIGVEDGQDEPVVAG